MSLYVPVNQTAQWDPKATTGIGHGPGLKGTQLVAPNTPSVPGVSPMASNAIPAATPGAVNLPYASNTTQMAGPNGPFSSLGTPLSGNATNLLTAGNTLLNTQFDPNNTLYNQELQKERNQTNVNEAARGITMSPYGAGVANQADINFNSDWQNQLQSRRIAAMQAAEGAMVPGSNLYTHSFGDSVSGYNTALPRESQQAAGVSSAPQTMRPSTGIDTSFSSYQPGSTINQEGVNYGQEPGNTYYTGIDPSFTSYQPGSTTNTEGVNYGQAVPYQTNPDGSPYISGDQNMNPSWGTNSDGSAINYGSNYGPQLPADYAAPIDSYLSTNLPGLTEPGSEYNLDSLFTGGGGGF